MCTILRRFFSDLRTDLLRGPSPRSGKCHCRFHRAIRNWLCNEQLASPVLGMHLWHNELRPSDNSTNSDEHDDYDDDHAEGFGGDGASKGMVVQCPRSRSRRETDVIMLVLLFAKRLGYPAETLTLRPAKCHCESPATKRDNNGEHELLRIEN